MNADINTAISTWVAAEKQLRAAIIAELEARALLTSLAFKDPTEGTNNAPIGNGYMLKGVFRNNYNLDNKRVEEQFKLLPRAVAQSLVSWEAKLKQGAYKGLEPAHKAIVNEVLTITPGRPSLEIVAPKER